MKKKKEVEELDQVNKDFSVFSLRSDLISGFKDPFLCPSHYNLRQSAEEVQAHRGNSNHGSLTIPTLYWGSHLSQNPSSPEIVGSTCHLRLLLQLTSCDSSPSMADGDEDVAEDEQHLQHAARGRLRERSSGYESIQTHVSEDSIPKHSVGQNSRAPTWKSKRVKTVEIVPLGGSETAV